MGGVAPSPSSVSQRSQFYNIITLRYSTLMAEKITIENLAGMIARWFAETAKKADMDARFDKVDQRLHRIENHLLADHKRRIEQLEAEVKELRTRAL